MTHALVRKRPEVRATSPRENSTPRTEIELRRRRPERF
jgi:hypothetical protein